MKAATVSEVAEWTRGRVANALALGDRMATIRVDRPAMLGSSKASDVAFFFSRDYEKELFTAQAGVLITAEPFIKPLEAAGLPFWSKTAVIACPDPYWAMAILSEKLGAQHSSCAHLPLRGKQGAATIHPSATVVATAQIGSAVSIGANCVIEDGVRVGSGSVLYPGCYLGPNSTIGEDTVLFPRVTIYEQTQIGNRVRIHAGAVIGADGFGYAPIRDSGRVLGHQKIYHIGRVVIGDDVEIGANSCVDRATFGETRIERNAKIDNLVQVGHNAKVDEGGIICGGGALAGNSSVGKYAYVGGLTGISNHVHVGDGASVGALSLVTKDVPPGGTAVGNPQREHKEHFRAHALLSRLLSDRKKKGREET